MILDSPTDRAEAALLGRILLDEEHRAAGRTTGPRLLEQVRSWGITSSALFGRTYTAHIWGRIQEVASTGAYITRPALSDHLVGIANTSAQTSLTTPETHPDLDRPAELCHLTDAAEATPTSADRCAGMVVSGAMHRSVHTMAADLAHASTNDGEEVATTITKAKATLTRMRTAWERLPPTARADLRALATPQRPATPVAQAQADLVEARSWMTELRQDPAHAAQMVADPAWRIVDRLLSVVDTLANASVDAPRSPDPGGRTFHGPGEILPNAEVTTEQRQAHAAEQNHDQDHVPPVEPAAPVIQDDGDQLAFDNYDARRSDPALHAERQVREARLLGSILDDPTQLDEVDLDPQGFSPDRRETVALIADLHQGGASIDPLTLDWAAQNRGVTIPETAVGEPLLPGEARAGLADHVAQDHAEQRVEQAIEELRALAITPSAPEDLITRAESALDQTGIDPPQLELALEGAHEPDTAFEPVSEDDPEAPQIPRTRACDDHIQDVAVLQHR